jgi:hypothetical protein
MCIDLNNNNYEQEPTFSGWKAVGIATVMIVILFVLVGWCLQLLLGAVDQMLGIYPQEISKISGQTERL